MLLSTPKNEKTQLKKRILFYNNKKVPTWAEDLQEVGKSSEAMKKTHNTNEIFGKLLPINNL